MTSTLSISHKRKHADGEDATSKMHNKHAKQSGNFSHAVRNSDSQEGIKRNDAGGKKRAQNILIDAMTTIRGMEALIANSTDDLIEKETTDLCVDLQTFLDGMKAKFGLEVGEVEGNMHFKSPDSTGKIVQPMSISPWKASTIPKKYPALPKILDPTLEDSAFTHIGCGSGSLADIQYERLEWVGDAYLFQISTLLISQTFPLFTPGKSSQIRESLVKNVQLSKYSEHYGFDKRVKLPRDFSADRREMTKVYGDVFEAYVAAVVLSDPVDGLRRVSEWLKALWGMTIQDTIREEERKGCIFESPMWKLRGNVVEQDMSRAARQIPLSAKEQLQKALGAKGIKISYEDVGQPTKDPKNKLPLFTVAVYLTGWGEDHKLLGSGKANGKKSAGLKAAEMALSNEGLMGIYAERKALHFKQFDQERLALEKPENP